MTKLSLMDEVGNIYTLKVSKDDAEKAQKDVLLHTTQLLNQYKTEVARDKPLAETESSSSFDNNVYNANEIIQEDQTMLEDQSASSQDKENFRWSHEAILLLLTEYKEQEDQIIYGKMSMKKFWMLIASKQVEKNYNVTGSQCKSKMGGLKNTYKSVKDHNSKSGNNTRTWQYLDIMDDLFKNKPWVAPVLTLDSSNATSSSEDNIDKNRKSPLSCKTELPSKRKKQNILLERIIAVTEQSTTQRQRMHEEALIRQNKLLDILQKMVTKQ